MYFFTSVIDKKNTEFYSYYPVVAGLDMTKMYTYILKKFQLFRILQDVTVVSNIITKSLTT